MSFFTINVSAPQHTDNSRFEAETDFLFASWQIPVYDSSQSPWSLQGHTGHPQFIFAQKRDEPHGHTIIFIPVEALRQSTGSG
jgi:hypothetical protein